MNISANAVILDNIIHEKGEKV